MRLSCRATLVAALAFLALLFGSSLSRADVGSLRIREPASGVVELTRAGNVYEGSFIVVNTGGAPLAATASTLGFERDTRMPPGVSVDADRANPPRIAPNQTARFIVRWSPAAGGAHEVYGHVVVQALGAGSVAVGVHGEIARDGLLGAHPLSLLVLIPLLGALAIIVIARRPSGERVVGSIALGASALELALGLYAYARFDSELGRQAGNDGFQLIERGRLWRSNVEVFLAVDGASLGVVVLIGLVSLVGAVALWRVELERVRLHSAALLLAGAAQGACVSVDLALFCASWALSLIGAVLLVRVPSRATLWRVAPVFGLSVVLLASGTYLLARAAGPALLADGTLASRAFSLPALVRANFAIGTALGFPVARVAWLMVLLAFAPFLPLYPAQGWLLRAVSQQAPGPGIWLLGILPPVACVGLARFALVASEGVVWSASALAWVGAIGALATALAAVSERDLRRAAALLTGPLGGLALLGLGGRTPAGAAGFMVAAVVMGLVGAVLMALVGALVERAGVAERHAFGGLLHEMPWLGASLALVTAAPFGVVGLLAGWPALLTVTGAFARAPGASLLGVSAIAIAGYASWRLTRALLLGDLPTAWRQSPRLEPFGGRFPDFDPRERACFLPFAMLVALLGVWPRPLFEPVERAALEMAAFFDPPSPVQVARLTSDKTLPRARAPR